MAMVFFVFIILVFLVFRIFEFILDYLNLIHLKKFGDIMPEGFEGII